MPRVLVVDDNPAMLRALGRMLGSTCDVMTAIDAAEALFRAEHFGPYSVVVLDQRMPGLTGVELVDQIKLRWPRTACVMLTGNPNDPGIKEQLGDGRLVRLLIKPCPLDEISKAVHDADRVYQVSQGITAEAVE